MSTATCAVTVDATVYPADGPYILRELHGEGRLGQHSVEYSTVLPTGAPVVYYRGRFATVSVESIVRALAQEIDLELDHFEPVWHTPDPERAP